MAIEIYESNTGWLGYHCEGLTRFLKIGILPLIYLTLFVIVGNIASHQIYRICYQPNTVVYIFVWLPQKEASRFISKFETTCTRTGRAVAVWDMGNVIYRWHWYRCCKSCVNVSCDWLCFLDQEGMEGMIMMSLMRELETINSLRQLSRVWLISSLRVWLSWSHCHEQNWISEHPWLEMLCDRNQFYFWLISSVRCSWRVTIPMRMLQEDTKAEFMQIYLLPLTATLRCLIHWPLSRQHYQGKKKKSCGWGAKMCILHPGFWLSVSNIAYWFAASCHTPDWAKLICSCFL